MFQPYIKWPPLSSAAKVVIALAIIAVLVVLAFFAPPEGESNNVTGDLETSPTVSITNLISTLEVNRAIDFQGVHITITQAMQATKFSNDRKPIGTYTIRVLLQTQNNGQKPIGISYDALVRLVLPNGQEVKPKYISVKPVLLPNVAQSGFFDFPTSTALPLSSLQLRFGSHTMVAFSKNEQRSQIITQALPFPPLPTRREPLPHHSHLAK
ncbi:MAG: hypothetical protein JO202_11190 [Ktedonobacteraceae bacterium]|nr:hypothetical protein [Ktedonobacteraceae bacterium]